MGFYATTAPVTADVSGRSRPAQADPPSKNRVRGFRGVASIRARFPAPQPLETQREIASTPTKTASGLSDWLSRDPIEEQGGFHLYGFVENDALNRMDDTGLWTLEFDGKWTEGQESRARGIFDTLKANMPGMLARCREWIVAAGKLPRDCAYKHRLQQELTVLLATLKAINSDLDSTSPLHLQQKNLGTDYAQAMFRRYPRMFAGIIRLSTGTHNWMQDEAEARESVFHELAHVAGVPDEDDLPTGWWTDDAHNIEMLGRRPDSYNLFDLVDFISLPECKRRGGPGLGTNCCPKKAEWMPLK